MTQEEYKTGNGLNKIRSNSDDVQLYRLGCYFSSDSAILRPAEFVPRLDHFQSDPNESGEKKLHQGLSKSLGNYNGRFMYSITEAI